MAGLALSVCACVSSDYRPRVFADVGSVSFESADGRLAIRFQAAAQVVQIEGVGGSPVASVRVEGERLIVDDSRGEALWFIDPDWPRLRLFELRRPGDETARFRLRLDPDGDLKVEDAGGTRVAEVKKRDYGYKIVVPGQGDVAKVRVRPQKVSIRNRQGVTYLATRDRIEPEAAAILAVERLPFEAAAGLAVALGIWTPSLVATSPSPATD